MAKSKEYDKQEALLDKFPILTNSTGVRNLLNIFGDKLTGIIFCFLPQGDLARVG